MSLEIQTIDPDYQAALDYLYSFVDFSLTRQQTLSPDKFDLRRMFRLMDALGNPQNSYPAIHIAGSKGKGSVAALCASVLHEAGYKTGLYTSPHLHDYCERIQVDGKPISHAELVALIEEIKPVVASIPELTTFEITTALGFVYFARQEVDVAVVEVGLGGRLDATNVIVPVLSVITSLSLDHTGVLGDTLAKISAEKAGIIKPGVPLVVSPQKAEAMQVLEDVAAQRDAPLTVVGRDVVYRAGSHSADEGQTLSVWLQSSNGDQEHLPGKMHLTIPLLGGHQVENAATAYAALLVFSEQGFPLSEEAIRSGFSQVKWPGRFEIIHKDPLLVVDSAHNRDSARRLRQALDDYFPRHRVILVFGASEDKDVAGMFAELMPRVDQLFVTRSFHPRAFEPEGLAEVARWSGMEAIVVEKVEQAAMAAAHIVALEAENTVDEKNLVLATGSLFIAAAARETWLAHYAGA